MEGNIALKWEVEIQRWFEQTNLTQLQRSHSALKHLGNPEGEKKINFLGLLLPLPWWVSLPDSRPQTQLCYKDLLFNTGALQSTACPELAFPLALFWCWGSNMHLHDQNADCLQNQKNHYMKTLYKNHYRPLLLSDTPNQAALGSSSTSGLISMPVLSQFHAMDNLNNLAD